MSKPKPTAQVKAHPKPTPVEEKKKEPLAMPVASALLNIRDRNKDYRSFIEKDGTCKDVYGKILGFINIDSLDCGSPNEEFWGAMQADGAVFDRNDDKIGEVNLEIGSVIDASGSTVAELTNAGEVQGHAGMYVGQFEGFTYKQMKIIALYLLIIDCGMMDDLEG